MGYSASRFFGDPSGDEARATWRARDLPRGVVLAGARIAGYWRRTSAADAIRVEIVLQERLTSERARALDTELDRLSRFTGRPIHVEHREP